MLKFPTLYFETPGDGGSGGSGGGAGAVDGGSGNAGGGSPTPIDLTNDSFVRIPGQKDPVKWSDFQRGYVPKADFTRSTQDYAGKLKAAQAEIARRDEALRQYQSRQNSAQPQQNPLVPFLNDLKSRTYLDGAAGAQIVEQFYTHGLMPLAGAIQQRDEVINMLWQRLKGVDSTVGSFKQQKTEADFNARLADAIKTHSLPDDDAVRELGRDVYLSHEGEDLDQEFPSMLKARYDALTKLIRLADQKRAQEGRARLFKPLESAGGSGVPSKPLANKKLMTADPKQLADELWPLVSGT